MTSVKTDLLKNEQRQALTNKDVCAVITTYNPAEDLVSNVGRIIDQVGLVVIVDDSGTVDVFRLLTSWFGDNQRVKVVHQSSNLGQAAALNLGVSTAREKGYLWMLTLDDDTSVEPDLVANLIDSFRLLSLGGGKPVAVIGMSHRDSRTGCEEAYPADGRRFVEKRGIITSGSLFSYDVYTQIGGFREDFFIDSVDYDFCLKARSKGYRIVKVCQLGMTHSLGFQERRQIGRFSIEITNHTAVRRYYMYRNSLVLAWEHCFHDPLFFLAVIYFNLRTALLILLFESNKYCKVIMLLRGTVDAFLGRMGKCQWSN